MMIDGSQFETFWHMVPLNYIMWAFGCTLTKGTLQDQVLGYSSDVVESSL